MYSPVYDSLFSILISIVQTVNTREDYETDCATVLLRKAYQNWAKQLLALAAERSNVLVHIPK